MVFDEIYYSTNFTKKDGECAHFSDLEAIANEMSCFFFTEVQFRGGTSNARKNGSRFKR